MSPTTKLKKFRHGLLMNTMRKAMPLHARVPLENGFEINVKLQGFLENCGKNEYLKTVVMFGMCVIIYKIWHVLNFLQYRIYMFIFGTNLVICCFLKSC